MTETMMRTMTTRRLVLAAALGFGAAIGPSTASAGPTVYVAGTEGEFGTVDLATGDFTSIGTLNLPGSSVIIGMGFGSDGKLYGLDLAGTNANLYQIDITNANTTLVGTLGHGALGATADAGGTLYALSADANPILYTLNPPSTATTVVGPTGIVSGIGLGAVNAGGTQFFAGSPDPTSDTTDLYNIDTQSGAATLVGDTGFSINNGLFVGGTLYGFDLETFAIVTIDTTTGAATQVATYSLPNGDSINASAVPALQITPVPEPSTLALITIGGIGALIYGWRRRWA
jgi:hypothetical protein